MERHYNHDLEICSHSHELLISIAATSNALPPLAVFHRWNSVYVQPSMSASASSSNAIPPTLGFEELNLLHGLGELGYSQLPATKVSSYCAIHDYLTTLMGTSAASDSENISSILSRLQRASSTSPLQAGFVSLHFLALVVHSNSSDALFSGGPAPAWKRFIPGNPSWLMKGSLWKPNVEDLLTYPERTPQGKQRLLLQGVSEERAEELRRSMVLFPASQENVTSHENSKIVG